VLDVQGHIINGFYAAKPFKYIMKLKLIAHLLSSLCILAVTGVKQRNSKRQDRIKRLPVEFDGHGGKHRFIGAVQFHT
jgi:hypothetical protein